MRDRAVELHEMKLPFDTIEKTMMKEFPAVDWGKRPRSAITSTVRRTLLKRQEDTQESERPRFHSKQWTMEEDELLRNVGDKTANSSCLASIRDFVQKMRTRYTPYYGRGYPAIQSRLRLLRREKRVLSQVKLSKLIWREEIERELVDVMHKSRTAVALTRLARKHHVPRTQMQYMWSCVRRKHNLKYQPMSDDLWRDSIENPTTIEDRGPRDEMLDTPCHALDEESSYQQDQDDLESDAVVATASTELVVYSEPQLSGDTPIDFVDDMNSVETTQPFAVDDDDPRKQQASRALISPATPPSDDDCSHQHLVARVQSQESREKFRVWSSRMQADVRFSRPHRLLQRRDAPCKVYGDVAFWWNNAKSIDVGSRTSCWQQLRKSVANWRTHKERNLKAVDCAKYKACIWSRQRWRRMKGSYFAFFRKWGQNSSNMVPMVFAVHERVPVYHSISQTTNLKDLMSVAIDCCTVKTRCCLTTSSTVTTIVLLLR